MPSGEERQGIGDSIAEKASSAIGKKLDNAISGVKSGVASTLHKQKLPDVLNANINEMAAEGLTYPRLKKVINELSDCQKKLKGFTKGIGVYADDAMDFCKESLPLLRNYQKLITSGTSLEYFVDKKTGVYDEFLFDKYVDRLSMNLEKLKECCDHSPAAEYTKGKTKLLDKYVLSTSSNYIGDYIKKLGESVDVIKNYLGNLGNEKDIKKRPELLFHKLETKNWGVFKRISVLNRVRKLVKSVGKAASEIGGRKETNFGGIGQTIKHAIGAATFAVDLDAIEHLFLLNSDSSVFDKACVTRTIKALKNYLSMLTKYPETVKFYKDNCKRCIKEFVRLLESYLRVIDDDKERVEVLKDILDFLNKYCDMKNNTCNVFVFAYEQDKQGESEPYQDVKYKRNIWKYGDLASGTKLQNNDGVDVTIDGWSLGNFLWAVREIVMRTLDSGNTDDTQAQKLKSDIDEAIDQVALLKGCNNRLAELDKNLGWKKSDRRTENGKKIVKYFDDKEKIWNEKKHIRYVCRAALDSLEQDFVALSNFKFKVKNKPVVLLGRDAKASLDACKYLANKIADDSIGCVAKVMENVKNINGLTNVEKKIDELEKWYKDTLEAANKSASSKKEETAKPTEETKAVAKAEKPVGTTSTTGKKQTEASVPTEVDSKETKEVEDMKSKLEAARTQAGSLLTTIKEGLTKLPDLLGFGKARKTLLEEFIKRKSDSKKGGLGKEKDWDAKKKEYTAAKDATENVEDAFKDLTKVEVKVDGKKEKLVPPNAAINDNAVIALLADEKKKSKVEDYVNTIVENRTLAENNLKGINSWADNMKMQAAKVGYKEVSTK